MIRVSSFTSGTSFQMMEYTIGTWIRLTWAILLVTITNSADASFGAIVFGRQASVPGIETITAPTFATVPLRVLIDRSKPVNDSLQQVQLQAANMMPFKQTEIQQIRCISEECALRCQFPITYGYPARATRRQTRLPRKYSV